MSRDTHELDDAQVVLVEEHPIVASGTGKGGKSYVCDRHRLKLGCPGIGYRSAARVAEGLIRAVDDTLTPEAVATVSRATPAAVRDSRRSSATARDHSTSILAALLLDAGAPPTVASAASPW